MIGKEQVRFRTDYLVAIYPANRTPEQVWCNGSLVGNGMVFPQHLLNGNEECKELILTMRDVIVKVSLENARKVSHDCMFVPDVKKHFPKAGTVRLAALTLPLKSKTIGIKCFATFSDAKVGIQSASTNGEIIEVTKTEFGLLARHTLPTHEGQCGAVIVNAAGNALGIHTLGGPSANAFYAWSEAEIQDIQNFRPHPQSA